MKTEKFLYQDKQWNFEGNNEKANMIICFGSQDLMTDEHYQSIKTHYPNAEIAMCSTAGEIFDTNVLDNTISGIAIEFEKTPFKTKMSNIANHKDSYQCGKEIAAQLNAKGLSHILVLSDGGLVNGSELVKGINSEVSEQVIVTGGMAGDGVNFEKTLVGLNGTILPGNVLCIGFFGDNLKVGHGSKGGWDEFGAQREVTKSENNVLYEMDGKNALELYKNYLGEKAKELPSSALLFPLSMEISEGKYVVRTILSIDEDNQSMTFAGDIPVGAKVKLMRANFDRLVDGAEDAATDVAQQLKKQNPDFAILISCVGRRLVLDQRIEEEVESVQDVFGENTDYIGFYSYGEISPLNPNSSCELHNQTMTITTYSES